MREPLVPPSDEAKTRPCPVRRRALGQLRIRSSGKKEVSL